MDVQVTGAEQILARLFFLEKRLGDLSPVYDEIGAFIESQANIRFDTKTDPDGHAWQAWADSTAKRRAKQGRGTLMSFSGLLRTSLTHTADADGVVVGFSATNKSGGGYASPLEFGAPSHNLPPRHMLLSSLADLSGGAAALGDEDWQGVVALLDTYFWNRT